MKIKLAGLFVILSFFLISCSQSSTEIVEITFDSNGGIIIDSLLIEKNSRPDLPIVFREGYEFLGWFTGEGVNEGQVTNAMLITQNITLKAKWKEIFLQEEFSEALVFSSTIFEGEKGYVVSSYLGFDKNIIIPDFYEGVPVIGIASLAFDSKGIESVKLSKNTKFIGEAAFIRNELNEISLNDGIQVIGSNSFAHNNLNQITIPDSVKKIDEFAFMFNSINQVDLGNGLLEIKKMAFWFNRITDIKVPSSVITIETEAFLDNPIKNVIIDGDSSRFDGIRYQIGLPKDYKIIYIASSEYSKENNLPSISLIESFTSENNLSFGVLSLAQTQSTDASVSQSTLLSLLGANPTELYIFDGNDAKLSREILSILQSYNRWDGKLFIQLNSNEADFLSRNINSILIGIKEEEQGFMAGYVAVTEGHTNLAVINDTLSLKNVSYATGFTAGAYYAADLLNKNITITYYNTVGLIVEEFQQKLQVPDDIELKLIVDGIFNDGISLIYGMFTFRDVNPLIKSAEESSGKLILNSSKDFVKSESVITTFEADYDRFLELQLGMFSRGNRNGFGSFLKLDHREEAISINEDYSRFDVYTLEKHLAIVELIKSRQIEVPNSQQALNQFLTNIDILNAELISTGPSSFFFR